MEDQREKAYETAVLKDETLLDVWDRLFEASNQAGSVGETSFTAVSQHCSPGDNILFVGVLSRRARTGQGGEGEQDGI